MLAVAVCAVLAGACTFAAITGWVRDLDRPAWGRLGFTDRLVSLPAEDARPATLRNTSIGYHRSNGETNIARTTRRANRRSTDLIDAVTRSNPTTQ